MKKLHILLTGLLCVSLTQAQDLTDAIRYSDSEIQGTARFRALSGAFGALGGDMSAVSINPASSVIFSQSHAAFTLSNTDVKNEAVYFGNTVNGKESDFNLAQAGASLVFASRSNSPWKKFSIGIAYDRTNNHDNYWRARGTNTNSDDVFFNNETNAILAPANSIAGYFFEHADGKRLDEISALDGESITDAYTDIGRAYGFSHQQGFLGYESYILEPATNDDANTIYTSNVAPGNFNHNYAYFASGYNGKLAFNFATQYKDKLSLGLNLNSHFIDYQKTTTLNETNNNTGSIVTDVYFENSLYTRGNGFSFQLGGILKLTPEFRIGLVYDSPTWYTIEEETTQYLDTDELANQGFNPLNPQTLNVYPRYNLQVPGKFTGSLAYIFGNQGLISFDYSRKDYSNIKFKPNYDFDDLNYEADNNLAAASTYRVGGEYKIDRVSLRGGYRFEESPYKDGETVGDLNGYSLGLGYSFGNTKLDFTFDQWKRSSLNNFYTLMSGGAPSAMVDSKNTTFTLSLSFNI